MGYLQLVAASGDSSQSGQGHGAPRMAPERSHAPTGMPTGLEPAVLLQETFSSHLATISTGLNHFSVYSQPRLGVYVYGGAQDPEGLGTGALGRGISVKTKTLEN